MDKDVSFELATNAGRDVVDSVLVGQGYRLTGNFTPNERTGHGVMIYSDREVGFEEHCLERYCTDFGSDTRFVSDAKTFVKTSAHIRDEALGMKRNLDEGEYLAEMREIREGIEATGHAAHLYREESLDGGKDFDLQTIE